MSKVDEYRDLLIVWGKWWNGPGRHEFHGTVLPPLTKTAEALHCVICAGVSESDGGRCAVCGRDVSIPPGA